MNKIRKLAKALWYNKERFFLVVMVLILSWTVFRVVVPPEGEEDLRVPPPPRSNIPEQWEGAPPPRPVMPGRPAQQDYSSLYTRNPWWFHGTAREADPRRPGRPEDPGIRLQSIQVPPRGGPMAQLVTNTARWYKEGDSFESYEVLSIDPDAGTVEVYSEGLGRRITLRVSG